MEAYNKKIRGMIDELDSRKHYDEPRHIYHASVHTPRPHILAGGNDMTGGGNIITFGLNDMKGDIVGPIPKRNPASKKRKSVLKRDFHKIRVIGALNQMMTEGSTVV